MVNEVKFKIQGGPLDGNKFGIAERMSCIVGRDSDCNIVIPDDVDMNVSSHHCILDINPPEIVVRDLGSSNGTFINGKRLYSASDTVEDNAELTVKMPDEYVLNHNDKLMIGETVFLVEIYGVANCINCGIEIPVSELSVHRRNTGCFQCESCYLDEHKVNLLQMELFGSSKASDNDATLPINSLFMAAQHPVQIDGYKIIRQLGEGGAGIVYLAQNEESQENIALKVLQPKTSISKYSRQSFLREMNNTRYLDHCNIVNFIDSGYSNGLFYFCMEYCPEGDLNQFMEKNGGYLKLDEAFNLIVQILDGLEYAHNVDIPFVQLEDGQIGDAKGLVHRDIKPGNILITHENGRTNAKLADFGFSKAFDLAGMSGCTLTGSVAGTPKYMPRNLLLNFKYSKSDIDVWAAAATFYFMLTGECPRHFPPGIDYLKQVLEADVIPIRKRNRDIPKKLAKVIDSALNEKKGLRFKSALEFKKALYTAIT
jgi:eukaryotic-like serine/threonine-protein kinase